MAIIETYQILIIVMVCMLLFVFTYLSCIYLSIVREQKRVDRMVALRERSEGRTWDGDGNGDVIVVMREHATSTTTSAADGGESGQGNRPVRVSATGNNNGNDNKGWRNWKVLLLARDIAGRIGIGRIRRAGAPERYTGPAHTNNNAHAHGFGAADNGQSHSAGESQIQSPLRVHRQNQIQRPGRSHTNSPSPAGNSIPMQNLI